MKRRLFVWVTFLAGLYYVLDFLSPPTFGGAPDHSGVTAPSPGRSPGAATGPLLCYTALRQDEPPLLMGAYVPPANANAQTATKTGILLAPSFARRDDYHGAMNAQLVGEDRLYYIGLGWDGKTPRICLARGSGDGWTPEDRAILDLGPAGAWDASGITWVSVLPPSEADAKWQMWYVGKQGDTGRVGYATSQDGLQWTKSAAPIIEAPDASIESITVLPWSGSLRAWYVQKDPSRPQGQLLTTTLSGPDGKPFGTPDPVAWQAPELRFGNLPHDAIPLQDARAVAASDETHHVRLYLSYLGADGKPRITVAENFPVAGIREPTVFARQAQPLLEPGSMPRRNWINAARGTMDNLIVIVMAFAVGLGLIGLSQLHGGHVRKRQSGWPESVVFFLSAGFMIAFALYARLNPGREDAGTKTFNLLFYGLFQPLGSAVFSLLAAYLVSAAYRAFRVRTLESALMAASAILIMLGQVPIGNWLTHALPEPMQIPSVMAWVIAVANNAVVRAINFGIFVGALATALRVWLSMEPALDQRGSG